MRVVMASTSSLSVVTSANSRATSAKVSSPSTMPWRWAFDFVDEGQLPLRTGAGDSGRQAHDPGAAGAGEHGELGADLLGSPRCTRPPAPAYSPSVFSRTTIQSRSPGSMPRRGLLTPGSGRAGRTRSRILIEALADGEAQAPQRDVVRDVRRANRAEVDGIEGAQAIEAVRRSSCGRAGDSAPEPHSKLSTSRRSSGARARKASSTSSPAAITPSPMPSPGITAIRCAATSSPFQIGTPTRAVIGSCWRHDQCRSGPIPRNGAYAEEHGAAAHEVAPTRGAVAAYARRCLRLTFASMVTAASSGRRCSMPHRDSKLRSERPCGASLNRSLAFSFQSYRCSGWSMRPWESMPAAWWGPADSHGRLDQAKASGNAGELRSG